MIPGGCTRVFTLTFPERERQKPAKPERRARYKKKTTKIHPLLPQIDYIPQFCGGMPLCRTRQSPVTKINIKQYTHLTTQYTGQLKHFV